MTVAVRERALEVPQGPTDEPAPPSDRPDESSARATRLLFLGQLAGKIMRFGTDLVIGRVLGPTGLGTIAASASLVQILAEVGLFGSHRAVLRFTSLGGAPARVMRLGLAIALSVAISLAGALVWFREPLRARLFPDAPTWLLPAFALAIPAIATFSILQFRARAQRRFAVDAGIGNLSRNGFPFVLTVGCLALGWGLAGATIGFTAGMLATVVVGAILLRRPFPDAATASDASPVSLRRFFATALPLAFASASVLLMNELDKVMLAIFRPESEVGVYNAAFRISRQTILLLPALNAAISPWVAPLLAEGRRGDLRRLYRQTTKWSLATGWSAALLFVAFAPDFLGLFGPAYVVGVGVLALLSAGQAVNAAVGNAGVVLQFSGHERREFVNGALGIVANVVLNLVLIPRWGAVGAGIATVSSLVIIAGLRLVQVRSVVGCYPYDRETLHVLGIGVVGVAVAWGLRAAALACGLPGLVALICAVGGMGATWLAVLWKFGVSSEEAALLRLPKRWIRDARS